MAQRQSHDVYATWVTDVTATENW